jgi:hypothetical protein
MSTVHAITGHDVRARKWLDPHGWIWSRVLASTGPPPDLR